jgi:dihydroorotate dehydrogenase
MHYFSLLKPLLYSLQPETAHHMALWALRNNLLPAQKLPPYPALETTLWGLKFPTPLGLAAGFDKDAECTEALLKQGFGFVEAGTVTPLPQAGNPRPRLFRLEEDKAIINRMGFNNKGMVAFKEQLQKARCGIVGSNIGKNKETADPVADYITLLNQLYAVSDYITINISSPNTPGLRALQHKEALGDLLSALHSERASLRAQHQKNTPLLLKIAPDITDREMEDIVDSALIYHIDGLIISNTTLQRGNLASSLKHETGGLSGQPLADLSTTLLHKIARITQGKLPLIGVGGIASGADAYRKIRSGASLVQVYSALIYQGFGLVLRINQELSELLARDGFASVSDAVGIDVKV